MKWRPANTPQEDRIGGSFTEGSGPDLPSVQSVHLHRAANHDYFLRSSASADNNTTQCPSQAKQSLLCFLRHSRPWTNLACHHHLHRCVVHSLTPTRCFTLRTADWAGGGWDETGTQRTVVCQEVIALAWTSVHSLPWHISVMSWTLWWNV